MAKCGDFWCEHYDKNKGNCDKCIKNEEAREKSDLSVILNRGAVRQMGIDRKGKAKGQGRQ